MDTLLSMRVFTRIVETGSFTRASDTIGLTTPRVSALLSALEQHLGFRLLNRTTRRISLTEDGQAYYERSVAVLREIDDMEASVSHARNVPHGRLKVNLPPAMAKQVMVPALPAFLAYLVEPYLKSGRLREVLTDFNTPARPISVLYPPRATDAWISDPRIGYHPYFSSTPT
ncbi:LysR family transcriptional regulator [Paraburkholderia lacunae]|uniref:LysR family transcriptional regulator n=1 Tax=Paraburkholderia lacunae TaxID=2211104 RepID=UPI001FCADEA1|nr:LysR family transcriptional regulator [Paraburkholderia lacunae]